jgi:hypothetical protein
MQTILFLFLFVPVQILAQSDCQLLQTKNINSLTCPQISIEQENLSNGAVTMEVSLSDNFQMRVTVYKALSGVLHHFSYNRGYRQLPILKTSDTQIIESMAQEIETRKLSKLFYLFEYFINLPPHESLDILAMPSGEVPWPSDKDKEDKGNDNDNDDRQSSYALYKPQERVSFLSLCGFVGKERLTFFELNKTLYSSRVTVGEPNEKCLGRCGFGCALMDPLNKSNYTQECLDHDFCHRLMGQNLGVCAPYFRKAVPSFLFAPNCKSA